MPKFINESNMLKIVMVKIDRHTDFLVLIKELPRFLKGT